MSQFPGAVLRPVIPVTNRSFGGVLTLHSMWGNTKVGLPQWRVRTVVVVLAALWVMNSAVFCFAAARAEAGMACCPPSDCGAMVSAAPQSCCTVQSNPTRPAVSPVVLTDHVADEAIGVVEVAANISFHQPSFLTPCVSPHAPPGCHSILRI